jgi:DNA-binding transcriptional LysR family regulator
VDLGIAEISTLGASQELKVEAIGCHEVVLFCRHDHPLAGAKELSAAELDDYPLAAVRLPPRVADVFPGKTWEDRETGDQVPAVEVDDLASCRQIVAQSNTFSAAAPLQIEPWLRSGELVALPFRAPWLRLNYGFIHLSERMLSPAAETYMQLVRDIDKELGRRNCELISEFLPVEV